MTKVKMINYLQMINNFTFQVIAKNSIFGIKTLKAIERMFLKIHDTKSK